ncbi:hypothetical protein [Bacillus sp. FJAT-27245]|uniref:hypothetical protein n=1 Tax=Bacillus sp. FJAT-27245 TaxID=1684144 RepID=UPI0012E230EB|nr:hypothetical protein [Bacillus sp. FJAT-27245]
MTCGKVVAFTDEKPLFADKDIAFTDNRLLFADKLVPFTDIASVNADKHSTTFYQVAAKPLLSIQPGFC